MIRALYRPLAGEAVLLVAGGLVVATMLYCVTYNALGGRGESLWEGALWAVVNVLPWYLAFEASKRAATAAAIMACLAAAFVASLLLHVLAYGSDAMAFELVRRLPALLIVVALLGTGRLLAANRAVPTGGGKGAPLPLPPGDFDWVSAAGNYVELRAPGRIVLHRAPLSLVEAQLERHGFVRIHRSTLVRRERIARVRPTDVVLEDGTSLRTGKRYRSALTLH